MNWMIRTDNGWVGRSTTTGPLTDTQAAAFAYCYETAYEANRVATMFDEEPGLVMVDPQGNTWTRDEIVEVLS